MNVSSFKLEACDGEGFLSVTKAGFTLRALALVSLLLYLEK